MRRHHTDPDAADWQVWFHRPKAEAPAWVSVVIREQFGHWPQLPKPCLLPGCLWADDETGEAEVIALGPVGGPCDETGLGFGPVPPETERPYGGLTFRTCGVVEFRRKGEG